MNHIKRSRITKALTDRPDEDTGFDVAEARLAGVRVAVVVLPDYAGTAAGQAAALTAVATSFKCFGNVVLCAQRDVNMVKPLSIGNTLYSAASALGARLSVTVPLDITSLILIGDDTDLWNCTFAIRCWWEGWLAGVVPIFDRRPLGRSGNPLAGVLAGALAVREIFASLLGSSRAGTHASIASIWEPWLTPERTSVGPVTAYFPRKLWFIGLGHLGQGYLWSLGLLPVAGSHAVLQDDQRIGVENEATGILTGGNDLNLPKTRVAARWLESTGWTTSLIERRNHGDIPLLENDPPIVLTGLDESQPRLEIATAAGFPYMIDAGVGHGPLDFENLQISVLKKGLDPTGFWSAKEKPRDIEALLRRKPYKVHSEEFGVCGTMGLAQASVAVPFVGAAVGALAIGQAIRLASMLETVQIMQLGLGAPDMVMSGIKNAAPESGLGSIEVAL